MTRQARPPFSLLTLIFLGSLGMLVLVLILGGMTELGWIK